MTTIYRAADSDDIRVGYSFSEVRETAEAYRHNPGFGGSTMWQAEVELTDVLDLTDADDVWQALSDAAGETISPDRHQYHLPRALTADDSVCDLLAAAGYRWVRFVDDFPEGAVTIVPVSSEAADEAEEAMVEVG